MNNKKKITMLLLTATAIGAYAQGNGMAGINEATKMVTSYFDPGTKLIYAIGAVVGLIGGIKVYNKFSSGDPDTSKTAASWFGACIFLIVAAIALQEETSQDCGSHDEEDTRTEPRGCGLACIGVTT